MAGERKIESRQVEGGAWQARFSDGGPNEFGQGATQGDAEKNLQERVIQSHADLGNTGSPPAGSLGATQEAGGTINHAIAHKSDRIVTRKLVRAVTQTVGGQPKTVEWVAYRENSPEVQSYGENEQGARVQYLTDEKQRQAAKPAGEGVVKVNPNADDVTHGEHDAAQAVVDASQKK